MGFGCYGARIYTIRWKVMKNMFYSLSFNSERNALTNVYPDNYIHDFPCVSSQHSGIRAINLGFPLGSFLMFHISEFYFW